MITLLSDFGLSDGYVGSLKGVIYCNYPAAKIVDITHDIKPFHIEQAAYILMSYYNYYPKGTIHVAVIDPGVGSSRTNLIVQTANYYFVGPDNGLFSFIFQKEAYTAYEIDRNIFSADISPTFHGRDIFAPVAAKLAKGVKHNVLAQPFLKKPVDFAQHLSEKENAFEAKIISIDRFGNIITNFPKFEFDTLLNKEIESISIKHQSDIPLKRTYSDVDSGEFIALWGSAGFLEISINKGNAAEVLQCNPKIDVVKINLHKKNKL